MQKNLRYFYRFASNLTTRIILTELIYASMHEKHVVFFKKKE